jgi:hypothetical protein
MQHFLSVEDAMSQSTRRLSAVGVLFILVLVGILVGCSSDTPGVTQKATATSGPQATATSQPSATTTPAPGTTPSPTATPATACNSAIKDITLPDRSTQVGSTTTAGATTTCAYSVPQDVQTVAAFFKTQMVKSSWILLHDNQEGPLGFAQVYVKGLRTATITLSQHESNANATDVSITVETSQ